ncbi:MAG: hypothetical protein KC451_15180 [Amylibacter sp.]|nr:hypothetical protein [Amylibacter sp.]
MKKLLGTTAVFIASASQVLAGIVDAPISVPEVGATGAVVALAAIAAGGALVWERRRARNKED